MVLLRKIIKVIKNWIVKDRKYFIASIALSVSTTIVFFIYATIYGDKIIGGDIIFLLEAIFIALLLSIVFFIGYFFLIMLLRLVYIGAEEFINDFLVSGLWGRLILVVAFASILYGHYKRSGPDRYNIYIYIVLAIFPAALVLFNKTRK